MATAGAARATTITDFGTLQRCEVSDCASIPLDDDAVDLVFCSPPYEAARTYGIGFTLRGQAWVDWAVPRFLECLRVSRGLVAWVVEGQTRGFRWSATPALLMADLARAGVKLRKPPVYKRFGIPGSGGPDWLRNDYELIVCAGPGRLPWSENTACGHPPKFPPGGAMSNRTVDGRRYKPRPRREGDTKRVRTYRPPTRANPGNVIDCGAVGGGHMGHDLAAENEAPFPLDLASFFVRSFCPPGGSVLDPFSGSGTTAHAAVVNGRDAYAFDIRQSQIDLTRRRIADVTGACS